MGDKIFPASALSTRKWKALIEPALKRAWEAIQAERFPHALLIVGPPGMGRELLAQELACSLITGEAPWGKSPAADRLRTGTHPDLQIVAGEGKKDSIKIATIREIVGSAAGRPFEGRKRVWVLDSAESRLEGHAANALLKVLEEPPSHVVFILLAENPQALLPTILSRCLKLKLPGVVGVAARRDSVGEAPPEIAHRSVGRKDLSEVLGKLRRSLPGILEGDRLEAIRTAGLLGGLEFGFEIGASAAMELAAEGAVGDAALAQLAARLLEADQQVRAFTLKPERQILSILLAAAGGEL